MIWVLVFFYNYRDLLRKEIKTILAPWTETTFSVEGAGVNIGVYPYWQQDKQRWIIHLVNYDYNEITDRVKLKSGLRLFATKDFSPDQWNGKAISPDFPGERSLKPAKSGDNTYWKLPDLDLYNLVVLEKK